MIYQNPRVEKYKRNEYRIYTESLKERLWVAWTLLRNPNKFRVHIILNNSEEWIAKNCTNIKYDMKNLKEIRD